MSVSNSLTIYSSGSLLDKVEGIVKCGLLLLPLRFLFLLFEHTIGIGMLIEVRLGCEFPKDIVHPSSIEDSSLNPSQV